MKCSIEVKSCKYNNSVFSNPKKFSAQALSRQFDVEAALSSDSTHIGLRNVRERIEKICGGTVTVTSVIGEGSEVVIRIPA